MENSELWNPKLYIFPLTKDLCLIKEDEKEVEGRYIFFFFFFLQIV